jgi:hypothetical protein
MRLQTALKAVIRLASWVPVSFSLLSDSQLTVAAHSVLETWYAVDLDTERCFTFRNDILPTLRIRVAAHSIISWSRSERSVTNCYVLSAQLLRCLARCYFLSLNRYALSHIITVLTHCYILSPIVTHLLESDLFVTCHPLSLITVLTHCYILSLPLVLTC